VTPNPAGKTYGDADPALTGVLNGFLATDNVTAIYSRATGETAGRYTISGTLSSTGALSNYDITYNTAAFTVNKATLTVTAVDTTKYLNAPNPTMTATFTGFKNGEDRATSGVMTGSPSLTSVATGTSPVGSYTITAAVGTLAATNYTFSFVNGTLRIVFSWNGFLQPINDTAHQIGINQSKFKLGQTIPAKFVIQDAMGNIVQQTGNPTFTRSTYRGSCDAGATLETTELFQADSVPEYKWDGGQYHYNWSTKGLTAGVYLIFANLADGTNHPVSICLQK
jgi:hypothetical protein